MSPGEDHGLSGRLIDGLVQADPRLMTAEFQVWISEPDEVFGYVLDE
jgi:hypothetical protein